MDKKELTQELCRTICNAFSCGYMSLDPKEPCKQFNNILAAFDTLKKQLPEGMQDCTILFKKCEKGHGRLTATNWLQHGCKKCETDALREDSKKGDHLIQSLQGMLSEVKEDRNALRKDIADLISLPQIYRDSDYLRGDRNHYKRLRCQGSGKLCSKVRCESSPCACKSCIAYWKVVAEQWEGK